ncbi:hypothetical protein FNU76_01415 [Chitinimonas arctica]|uniref:Uncharacterized protein n=1 Tax=Chitinimonas arctica TaxID=2594795 RepID=A0A516SAE7_9NEIS|nr:hypothetical protein [Chitinimonas arctica]QDQ25119.1 hypothetical protein FNU76_01415 [Chitinimonas arctica]
MFNTIHTNKRVNRLDSPPPDQPKVGKLNSFKIIVLRERKSESERFENCDAVANHLACQVRLSPSENIKISFRIGKPTSTRCYKAVITKRRFLWIKSREWNIKITSKIVDGLDDVAGVNVRKKKSLARRFSSALRRFFFSTKASRIAKQFTADEKEAPKSITRIKEQLQRNIDSLLSDYNNILAQLALMRTTYNSQKNLISKADRKKMEETYKEKINEAQSLENLRNHMKYFNHITYRLRENPITRHALNEHFNETIADLLGNPDVLLADPLFYALADPNLKQLWIKRCSTANA